jgi:hypothetical protein
MANQSRWLVFCLKLMVSYVPKRIHLRMVMLRRVAIWFALLSSVFFCETEPCEPPESEELRRKHRPQMLA